MGIAFFLKNGYKKSSVAPIWGNEAFFDIFIDFSVFPMYTENTKRLPVTVSPKVKEK